MDGETKKWLIDLQPDSLIPEPVRTTEAVYHVLHAQRQVGKCVLTAAHKEKQINK